MTRTTPPLATTSPNFRDTLARGRLTTTYDLTCNKPDTRRVFSGIGLRTCHPPAPNNRVNVLADRWRGGIPSCTCVFNDFASISSFLESCFRSLLHDGFLQISTKSSYPISSLRRGACFTNLSQDGRGVWRVMPHKVQHISVVSALRGGTRKHQRLARPWAGARYDQQCHDFSCELIRQNRRITTSEIVVELSISKGTVHHIIHTKLGYGKVYAQWVPKHLSENQKKARMGVCRTQKFLH
ncbi:hypothetical protein AVEN_197518-1 [Araneus ventricosus]|uniref:Uncharacterized protein n=1 Tax=Araneus ventricosus TaxID=182803 RepID=A0A4Y2BTQ3_ARAVE|nr:hypothetical protein AVEN_197518-1 [Araneus ventricosus]